MKGSSSYSREQGQAAKEFFTQVKTIYLDRAKQLILVLMLDLHNDSVAGF